MAKNVDELKWNTERPNETGVDRKNSQKKIQ